MSFSIILPCLNIHLAGMPLTRVWRLKLFLKHKLLVKTSIINDVVKQFVPTTNKSLTATKLTQCRLAKALPLLRLAIGR
jgi:hypothetical protein